jgi:hypothetical protein
MSIGHFATVSKLGPDVGILLQVRVCAYLPSVLAAPPPQRTPVGDFLTSPKIQNCQPSFLAQRESDISDIRHPSPLDRMMGQPANSRPRADGPYEYLVTFQVRKRAHQDGHRRNSFPIQECCKNLTASFAPIQTMCPKGLGSMSVYLPSSGTNGCLALLET